MVRKRTPLEQAVAERSDRRARYEKAMRDRGFKKTSIWLPADCEEHIRTLVTYLGSANGEARKRLAQFVADLEGEGS